MCVTLQLWLLLVVYCTTCVRCMVMPSVKNGWKELIDKTLVVLQPAVVVLNPQKVL